ncbi:unnamed protein product [Lactuca virosa]|uniref:Uncharacterized protein n=1 Tax=Lactuca virosa TaxID=75947 RepID=A0AAU9NPN9_9ASTR|nr:unnamed protein product [Lactuca virosa]
MEIGLNKQENTKTSEFMSFSIREYVAEIRKKDRKKCWPFGSLGDPEKYDVFASYQSVESTFLCSQNYPSDHIDGSDDKPEHKEASNPSNKETLNGKEDQDRSQTTDMIESLGANGINICKRVNNGYPDSKSCKVIYKDQNRTENSANGSGDNDKPGRNQPRRKHQKLCLLSDILRNLDKVNTKSTTESKDELDDITLDVKVTTMSKNKMMTNGVEETRFENEEKSQCGSKNSHENDSRKTRIDDMDFQAMTKRRKVRPLEENGIQSTEIANEDSEMEAVMLLATHFNEENPSSSGDDAKRVQIVQSNMELESLEGEASKHITTYSPILSSSGGYRAEFRHDQGFAMGTPCACVHKKIRVSLGTENRSSTAGIFQNNLTLVCSINRNPADFSIPNAQNVFMRGG